MSQTEWTTKLEYVRTIDNPLRRRLYVCALLTQALSLRSHESPPVVIGWQAVEFYTLGNYATMDTNLVSPRRTEIGNLLEGTGLAKISTSQLRFPTTFLPNLKIR